MDLDFRPVIPDEAERYLRALESAFINVPDEEDLRTVLSLLELDRTIAAFDQERIVGSAAAYSLELTIPGGILPMAGVTLVAVVPTHRRRGILAELMRRQLEDVRDRGEVVAGLWASEGAIYQRFGYGLAALHARFAVDRTRTAFARTSPEDPGELRMVPREEAMPAMAAVYDRVRVRVPGMLARPPVWWDALYADRERDRDGAGPLFFVLHRTGDQPDGYAAYRAKNGWENGSSSGEAQVHEVMAETPAAYEALWRFLLNLDLVASITAWKRPADDPLLYLLAEPRRLRFELQDALWLRLVDVPAALMARRYAAEGWVTFAVRDRDCPWNEGVVELVGGPQGADTRRVDAAPDLVVDVADLGAVYLGGTTFDRLARAGRVAAASEDALRRADMMFATPQAPWCPHIF